MPASLAEKLQRMIANDGPLTIAAYMQLCMNDPDFGYYRNHNPLGRDGDFTTAPEISQIFGELLGAWALAAWNQLGAPNRFQLVEIGPGRGTMMADMLRVAGTLPPFLDAASVALVETSPALRAVQKTTIGENSGHVAWYDTLGEVPDQPAILFANELFDVLAVHQYQFTDNGWSERMVGIDNAGNLAPGLRPVTLDPSMVPVLAGKPTPGAIYEHSPAREALMHDLALRLCRNGGAALIIDYGHSQPGFGETLQAIKAHRFASVFADPGAVDLTAHVDFAALAKVAKTVGATVSPIMTQGEFLMRFGLRQRLEKLVAGKDRQTAEAVTKGAERLIAPEQMGTLFKGMAIAGADITLPGFG